MQKDLEAFPRTQHYCWTCKDFTAHEIRATGTMKVMLCLNCTNRALDYELSRD